VETVAPSSAGAGAGLHRQALAVERPLLVTLPLSLAIHTVGVALALLLVRGGDADRVLSVDLTEPLAGGTPVASAPTSSAPSPAESPRASAAPGTRERAPSSAAAAAPPGAPSPRPARESAGPPGRPADRVAAARRVPEPPSAATRPPDVPSAPRADSPPAPSRAAAPPDAPAAAEPRRSPERPEERHDAAGAPVVGGDAHADRLPPGLPEHAERTVDSFVTDAPSAAPSPRGAGTGSPAGEVGGRGRGTTARAPATTDGAGTGDGAPGGPRTGAGTSGDSAAGGGAAVASLVPGVGGGDGEYWALVRRRIQEGLRYPASAQRRRLTGTVELEVALTRDGAVRDVRVVSSSTHPVLDEAALEAARRLPRMPFPPRLGAREVRATLPVVFELR
jgi:TonB family protein